MAYGDTFLISSVDEALEILLKSQDKPPSYIKDILLIVWGLGFHVGKNREKERICEFLGLTTNFVQPLNKGE